VSALVFVPLWIAGVVLALDTIQEIPSPAFVVGGLVLGIVPILLATVGSDIIYGLRRQVSEAMQLGQYTLESKIGEGGNGAVYRAHHALLRRPTAIKLLVPQRIGGATVERFEREVHRYGDRHRVKAGITGWAQVHGLRGKTSISDRVEWDNYYIANWSLWLDLKIVLMTLFAVVASSRNVE
jgi:hypothetical protein